MTHYLGGLTTYTDYWIRIKSENADGGRSDWSQVRREEPYRVALVEPVADSIYEGAAAQFRFSISPRSNQTEPSRTASPWTETSA